MQFIVLFTFLLLH